MEDSTIIAIVTVVCSSAATVIITVSSHVIGVLASRGKRRAAYAARRIKALENYFEAVFGYGNAENTRDFCKISGIVRMYVDPKLWCLLDQIYDAKMNHNDAAARDASERLMRSMRFKESRFLLIRAKKHADRQTGDQADE